MPRNADILLSQGRRMACTQSSLTPWVTHGQFLLKVRSLVAFQKVGMAPTFGGRHPPGEMRAILVIVCPPPSLLLSTLVMNAQH